MNKLTDVLAQVIATLLAVAVILGLVVVIALLARLVLGA